MEITLKLEVSERLHAIAERFAALAERYLDGPALAVPAEKPFSGDAYPWVCPGGAHAESAEVTPESVEHAEVVNPPTEDAVSDAPADAGPAQDSDRPKSRRGRPRKPAKVEPTETAEIAPQEPEPAEAVNLPTDDKSDAQAQASGTPEPVSPPAPAPADPTPAPAADPYHGMTLMQATQALFTEIAGKGLELADVNARIRKECEARGLQYGSAACLMKSVGYDKTRKIAFGE